MKVIIVGMDTRRTGESSKKTGKPYDGQTVYYTCTAVGVTGVKTGSIYASYIGDMPWPDVGMGDTVLLDFDEGGKLTSVDLVKQAKA